MCTLTINKDGSSNIEKLYFFKNDIVHAYTGDVAKEIIKNIYFAATSDTKDETSRKEEILNRRKNNNHGKEKNRITKSRTKERNL